MASQAQKSFQRGRFKDAIEAFKQLVKLDPQPVWQRGLQESYAGYGRVLAAKGMFKEAAIVLENTRTAQGWVLEPMLYLFCLVRQGQMQKALPLVVQVAADPALHTEFAAGLTVIAWFSAPAGGGPAERPVGSWAGWCDAAAKAILAWSDGADAAEVMRLLDRISLRSPLKSLRLSLKALLCTDDTPERRRQMLAMIPPDSVFVPFQAVISAVISADIRVLLQAWPQFSPAQQALAANLLGTTETQRILLAQLLEAERQGAAALLTLLLKQAGKLPDTDLRDACYQLLPQAVEQIPGFEKRFGPLSPFERNRILALNAEADRDWGLAYFYWQHAAQMLADQPNRQSRLERALIYRHLASFPENALERTPGQDPVTELLALSLAADPDHLGTVLAVIRRYRADDQMDEWQRSVDAALLKFPAEIAVLSEAVDVSASHKAYKKAAGFARKLLALDPINSSARQRMIELHLAQARKQIKSRRRDLAARTLVEAAEWERPDSPNAGLAIFRGLLGLLQGADAEAAAGDLRAGVALAGPAPIGWFRALLEAGMIDATALLQQNFRRELKDALKTAPSREAALGIIGLLEQREIRDAKRIVTENLRWIRPWLLTARMLAWIPAEFRLIMECYERLKAFDLLLAYAKAALLREPGNLHYRFYEILAKCEGEAGRITLAHENILQDLVEQGTESRDFHLVSRIMRLMGGADLRSLLGGGGQNPFAFDPFDLGPIDEEAMEQQIIEDLIQSIPKPIARHLKAAIRDLGPEGAAAKLAQGLTDMIDAGELSEAGRHRVAAALVARIGGR